MEPTKELSEKDLAEYREIFDLVDTNHTGAMSLQELRRLMDALHLMPTEQELEEMFEDAYATTSGATGAEHAAPAAPAAAANIGASPPIPGKSILSTGSNTAGPTKPRSVTPTGRTIDFAQFAAIMSRRVQSEYSAEQLRGAFQLFETREEAEGVVSTAVLKHALMTYGTHPVSEEEAERLVRAIDPDRAGHVNYNKFVDMLAGEN